MLSTFVHFFTVKFFPKKNFPNAILAYYRGRSCQEWRQNCDLTDAGRVRHFYLFGVEKAVWTRKAEMLSTFVHFFTVKFFPKKNFPNSIFSVSAKKFFPKFFRSGFQRKYLAISCERTSCEPTSWKQLPNLTGKKKRKQVTFDWVLWWKLKDQFDSSTSLQTPIQRPH